MYLNPILILYHFKPLMALMLQKYTLDQSTWQTGKRGMAKTFDGTWGFCLAHPAEQRWGTHKIPGSQAGSPRAEGTGGESLTRISGEWDGAREHESGNMSLAGRDGMEVGSWCCKRKPLLSSGLFGRVWSPLVLLPFNLAWAKCQRSMSWAF